LKSFFQKILSPDGVNRLFIAKDDDLPGVFNRVKPAPPQFAFECSHPDKHIDITGISPYHPAFAGGL